MKNTEQFLSAQQMRTADHRCIAELGIPGAVLMNQAGVAVLNQIHGGPVGIVCGKGNNGGDGLVIARLALLQGYQPRVVLLAEVDEVQGDARLFLDVYRRLHGPLICAPGAEAAAREVAKLGDCEVLVDAMLGTGAEGSPREPARSAILAWPNRRTVAVDVPSGLDADTGEVDGPCIRADVTVAIQFAKAGFQNPAARAFLGTVVVADIGIPAVCADDAAWEALRRTWG